MPGSKIPHFNVGRDPVHITYRLSESVPVSVLKAAQSKRDRRIALIKSAAEEMDADVAVEYLQQNYFEINGRYELAIDDYLNNQHNGPYYLAQPELATIVLDSLRLLHNKNAIYLYAACVMSNHVHAIIGTPESVEKVEISTVMKSHKGFTARMCNRLLHKTGTPFWDDGYFDRTIRQGKFIRVMWYVLNNPVKIGLVKNWEEWAHTWVNPEFELLFKT